MLVLVPITCTWYGSGGRRRMLLLSVSKVESSLPDKEAFHVAYIVVAFETVRLAGELSSEVKLTGITGGAARVKAQIWRRIASGSLPKRFMVRGILSPALRS